MTAADALAETRAVDLERLHAETGDRRFLAAASVLRGAPLGRPPLDDAEALREIEALMEDGTAVTFNAAAIRVAARMPGHSHTSTVERLRRKHQRLKEKASTKVKLNESLSPVA